MSVIKDAIYGFAIGDALGVPYEFKSRGTFKCNDMIGYGTWNQPAGTWSDDTSMTLATLESISKKGCIDLKDIMNNFLSWYLMGKYTANGLFDIGSTTQCALEKFARTENINCGLRRFQNNGNGSLMRMLPLAFINCTDEEIKDVSALTHAHELSIETCIIYVYLTRKLIENKNIKETFKYHYDYYKGLSNNFINSTGFVIDTFDAAIWCLINSNSYVEAVLNAVNLGGDTDTIAAITGGWAGIVYGYDSIPKKWINLLKNKKLIDKIIRRTNYERN